MPKINWKSSIFIILILLLIYSRFVNLSWGLPYPMHPDERNMAVAVQSLKCEISNLKDCFNPHFFAYGQFPIYLGSIGVFLMKFFDGDLRTPISFQEAIISLRIISAIASVLTVFVLLGIIHNLVNQNRKKTFSILHTPFSLLLVIFSPVLIQFSHFGTTESLLILFYSFIIYYSLLCIQNKILVSKYVVLTSLFSGMAAATKISSALYIVIPILVLLIQSKKVFISSVRLFLFLTAIFFILFSPHNLLSFNEFLNSFHYESTVALGQLKVFYTRQFEHSIPIIFQIKNIFPYALGWPIFLLGLLGVIFLSWKKKEFNLFRIALAAVFIPNAFIYAKWTRFIAPAFPILIIFAILFLSKIKRLRFIFYILCFICLIPGMAYLSIYQNNDVRFQASEWISKNIPKNSRILSESANVVDIPLVNYQYQLVNFNFYDLDTDTRLQEELVGLIQNSEYIIVPSRRVFKNHTSEKYPLLNEYYKRLFDGTLGFKEIAEFSSYPKVKLLGKTVVEFPDESAEETWTVFDHPVIRIYKRI